MTPPPDAAARASGEGAGERGAWEQAAQMAEDYDGGMDATAFRLKWGTTDGLTLPEALRERAAARAAREPESEAVAYWRTRAEEADARLRIQEHDLARLSKREEG